MNRCKLIAAAAIGWLAGAFGGQLVNPGFEEPTMDGTVPGWTWLCDDSVAKVSVVAGVDVSSPDLKVRTWEVGGRTVALVVNGAYRPVSGTVRCAGRAPLEVRLGALAHGYYVLQK